MATMARGDSWKSSKWGGGGGSWKFNGRGWMRKEALGGGDWGGSLSSMGGRWGGNSKWGGRSHVRSALSGSWASGSIRGGVRSSFGVYEPGGLKGRGERGGGIGLGLGLAGGMTSALMGDRDQAGPDEPNGLMSSTELSFPSGGNHPASELPDEADFEAIRKRAKSTVESLARRYADAVSDEERKSVAAALVEVVGPKYGRLVVEWAAKQPEANEYGPFVLTVVEAAAFDAGREPLLWKLQRFIGWLLSKITGGGDRNAEALPQSA